MLDHTDIVNLDKIVFYDQNVERSSWFCLGQTCSWYLIVFYPNFFITSIYLRLLLAYTLGEDLWRIYSLGGNLVQRSRMYFTFPKVMNELISTKNCILYLWLDRAILAKRTWYMSGWKLLHFNSSSTKVFFLSKTLTTVWCHAKRKW